MKSPSSDERAIVLTGRAADAVAPARLHSDLRTSPFARVQGVDPRLVDPTLEAELAVAAAEVRERARKEGFEAGWSEGLFAGRARAEAVAEQERARAAAAGREREQRCAAVLGRLSVAAQELEQRMVPLAAEVEDQVVGIAFELLEVMLGREVTLSAQPGAEALRRALDLAPRSRPVVARLHPDEAAELGVGTLVVDDREVVVVADPSVGRGDCVLDCDATRVDATLEAAMERVRAVLRP